MKTPSTLANSSVPVVPARSGAEVAIEIYYKTFVIYTIELACAVRQPGPCVRALREAVARLLSKNMTCTRPRRNATPSKHFPHTSHCTLHTSHLHFTLHTSSHLRSCELSSPHLTSPQLFSPHLTSSQLFSSHPISSHMSSR